MFSLKSGLKPQEIQSRHRVGRRHKKIDCYSKNKQRSISYKFTDGRQTYAILRMCALLIRWSILVLQERGDGRAILLDITVQYYIDHMKGGGGQLGEHREVQRPWPQQQLHQPSSKTHQTNVIHISSTKSTPHRQCRGRLIYRRHTALIPYFGVILSVGSTCCVITPVVEALLIALSL